MSGTGIPEVQDIRRTILTPGSETHAKLLEHLKKRIEMSERKMRDFYPRWQVNERKLQAYINLNDYERLVQQTNDRSQGPPQIVSLVVPYSYAVVQTVVTYLLHTFCGRQPIFQVGCYNADLTANAQNLERVIQYNCDHSKFIYHLYQMLMCSQIYQLGAMRVGWAHRYVDKTRWQEVPKWGLLGEPLPPERMASRERILSYSGNEVASIDPFMFFPDPRVPMTECSRRGEFMFWRAYENRMTLKTREKEGVFMYVDAAPTTLPNSANSTESARSLRSSGDAIAGQMNRSESHNAEPVIQLDEGTVLIIPKEWGLSDKDYPELWLFTILNKGQVVRAEPLEADHNLHPVNVIEPNAIGAQFGSLAMVDIVGPVQDHISWLINSHMQNVRGVINNRLVVNPQFIHMEDFKKDPSSPDSKGDPSWIVRMKQSAMGAKPEDGIFQLQVADVTQQHLRNVELMMRVGHMFAGVNENLMGLQDAKGRKTATEVRTSGEAGASRLAAMARVISAQGIADIPMMMGCNLQQRMDQEFYARVLGSQGQQAPIRMENIAGDFYYPINDGTLPLDRAAMLNVWQQILLGVAKDPELRQNYSLSKLFAYVAELGGARNIDQFKVSVAPPGMAGAPANTVPVDAAAMAAMQQGA